MKVDNVTESGKTYFNDFNWDLTRYVNYGGALSKYESYISIVLPSFTFKVNALRITQSFKKYLNRAHRKTDTSLEVHIQPYDHGNSHVWAMIHYLQKYLKDDLVGAYLHGSLGTYEEIPYSDFDALVIIKDHVLKDSDNLAKAARSLYESQSIMFDFDPLQHHGWFILTEADLKYYPEHYFPLELFAHAKSLFHDKGLTLTAHTQYSSDNNRQAFNDLSNSIIKRIDANKYPNNMFQLKGLLSEFMLLPAFYLEARNGKGIYKKDSFNKAKEDFSERDWSIMDEVSLLREQWAYDISFLQKWLLTRRPPISRFLARYYAPVIPKGMKKTLTDDFYHRIQNLALLMQKNLQ